MVMFSAVQDQHGGAAFSSKLEPLQAQKSRHLENSNLEETKIELYLQELGRNS